MSRACCGAKAIPLDGQCGVTESNFQAKHPFRTSVPDVTGLMSTACQCSDLFFTD